MEKGDLITLVGGIVLVFVIALILNPQYLSGLPGVGETPLVSPSPTMVSTVTRPHTASPVTPVTVPITATPTVEPTIAPPYRLFYNSSPFSYPRFKMPDNIYIYGAGDIPFRGREMVTFAFINESRGGLSQRFNVPYPVWSLNATVNAERTPQYGNFKMVLCYANNGTVIDGMEILNRGSMTRVIQTYGVDVYMIITTAYIDSYQIDLETPKDYYVQYKDN